MRTRILFSYLRPEWNCLHYSCHTVFQHWFLDAGISREIVNSPIKMRYFRFVLHLGRPFHSLCIFTSKKLLKCCTLNPMPDIVFIIVCFHCFFHNFIDGKVVFIVANVICSLPRSLYFLRGTAFLLVAQWPDHAQ